MYLYENKPAAQAAGTDPFLYNYTNRQNQQNQQYLHIFWIIFEIYIPFKI